MIAFSISDPIAVHEKREREREAELTSTHRNHDTITQSLTFQAKDEDEFHVNLCDINHVRD